MPMYAVTLRDPDGKTRKVRLMESCATDAERIVKNENKNSTVVECIRAEDSKSPRKVVHY